MLPLSRNSGGARVGVIESAEKLLEQRGSSASPKIPCAISKAGGFHDEGYEKGKAT